MNTNQSVFDLDQMEQLSELIHQYILALPHQSVSLQRGEVIYHQGDKIEKVGLITEGMLKCANYTNGGDEINPHYFYQGEIFPEYLLLSGEDEYIYTLIAEKRSRIILVDFQSFRELLVQDPRWGQLLIAYMAKRGLLAEKWKLCNCYGNLRSSMAYMLLEIYRISDEHWTEIKDSQQIISAKLQISRTAYNLELAKLEKEGVILRSKSKIKILDRRKLEVCL